MSVVKTASAAQVSAGDAIDFTLAVRNPRFLGRRQRRARRHHAGRLLRDRSGRSSGATCTSTASSITCNWASFLVGGPSNVVVHAVVAADAPHRHRDEHRGGRSPRRRPGYHEQRQLRRRRGRPERRPEHRQDGSGDRRARQRLHLHAHGRERRSIRRPWRLAHRCAARRIPGCHRQRLRVLDRRRNRRVRTRRHRPWWVGGRPGHRHLEHDGHRIVSNTATTTSATPDPNTATTPRPSTSRSRRTPMCASSRRHRPRPSRSAERPRSR